MGVTYGFLKTASGQSIRLYANLSDTNETELTTDATNEPGKVPVAQSVGDALNGQVITHALFTEASGFLKIVYVMDKGGNTKGVFTNLGKTGAAELGIEPMYKPIQIEIGDQVRATMKSNNNTGCAVICFADGSQQHYSCTGTTANTEMTEYKSGNGLGTAGTGSGAIVAYAVYAADGVIKTCSVVDNQNVLRLSLPGASTETFSAMKTKLVNPGVMPNLNWKLSASLA